MKLGFIGLGNMATAMISGILRAGIVDPCDIAGSCATENRARNAEELFGIRAFCDNNAVIEDADYIILAVKPQMYETVLTQIGRAIRPEQVLVSLAPGKTLEYLAGEIGEDRKIVRLMPNTPALVSEGCTGACRNENVTDEEFDEVMSLLSSFGKAYEVGEKQMDAVVAVSGSAPAYVFMMIEAMADGAVAEGLNRVTATQMAAQAVLGSAKMVLELERHPGELKDMVCSPGGTTIQAVRILEEAGFRGAIIDAEKACAEKSRGL